MSTKKLSGHDPPKALRPLQDDFAGRLHFVNTEQVVEHLSNPRPLVEQLRTLMAPGGLMKHSVPDGSSALQTLNGWNWTGAYAQRDDILPLHPLEHLNCFTRESLNRFGIQCGLRRERLPLRIAYGFPGDWSNARSAAKNLVRPIKRLVMMKGCYALFSRVGCSLTAVPGFHPKRTTLGRGCR